MVVWIVSFSSFASWYTWEKGLPSLAGDGGGNASSSPYGEEHVLL